ncbi:hypothetical protein E4T56_gene13429 [Termitomyces sp. T112]|nr:hypothetical protein E4T56_gene13429 [Termitomyces sp. T112]
MQSISSARNPAAPRKFFSNAREVGVFQCLRASTLLGSIRIPSRSTIRPRIFISLHRNCNFDSLRSLKLHKEVIHQCLVCLPSSVECDQVPHGSVHMHLGCRSRFKNWLLQPVSRFPPYQVKLRQVSRTRFRDTQHRLVWHILEEASWFTSIPARGNDVLLPMTMQYCIVPAKVHYIKPPLLIYTLILKSHNSVVVNPRPRPLCSHLNIQRYEIPQGSRIQQGSNWAPIYMYYHDNWFGYHTFRVVDFRCISLQVMHTSVVLPHFPLYGQQAPFRVSIHSPRSRGSSNMFLKLHPSQQACFTYHSLMSNPSRIASLLSRKVVKASFESQTRISTWSLIIESTLSSFKNVLYQLPSTGGSSRSEAPRGIHPWLQANHQQSESLSFHLCKYLIPWVWCLGL